jgi:hypothetical protein
VRAPVRLFAAAMISSSRARKDVRAPIAAVACAASARGVTLPSVERARRHHRALAASAFGLLALVAELAGRSLTHRIDIGRHVESPSYSGADYYPFLLAFVKVGIALLLARLVWRFVRARATARAAERVLGAVRHRPAPRLRLELSPRLWALTFATTSLLYLVQTDAEGISTGSWPLFAPWLHSSALPVFAVLSVVVALLYGAVARWLTEYERYAADAAEHARRTITARRDPLPRPTTVALAPRRLFGLAFESRPPPLAA